MARRLLDDGFELDDDPERIDLVAVHRFLSAEAYWALGRSFEAVERSWRQAARVVGIYDAEGRQVGYARVVSDGLSCTYLADVYVLAEHRGRGLGAELVRETVENGPLAHLRWFLHTADAHGLYRRFGFGEPGPKALERPAAAGA